MPRQEISIEPKAHDPMEEFSRTNAPELWLCACIAGWSTFAGVVCRNVHSGGDIEPGLFYWAWYV